MRGKEMAPFTDGVVSSRSHYFTGVKTNPCYCTLSKIIEINNLCILFFIFSGSLQIHVKGTQECFCFIFTSFLSQVINNSW